MTKGVNKVILIGNLGRDPETKYLPSGSAVTNITVATSESWMDKQSGQKQEKTEWHRVVFFNKLAEVAGQYLKKGRKVYVQGKLVTRSWEKDGQKHYSTEIHAHEMQMLDGLAGGDQDAADAPAQSQQRAPRQQQAPQTGGMDFDDDITF